MKLLSPSLLVMLALLLVSALVVPITRTMVMTLTLSKEYPIQECTK